MRTRHTARRVSVGLLIAALGLGLVEARTGAKQIGAGILSTTRDLETWSTYHDDSRMTEKGLGLILSGSGGTTKLSLSAQLEGRFPNKPPAMVRVRASADPRTNPNTLRTPALKFFVDAKEEKPWVLDLSSSMVPDDPAPGSNISDAVAQIKAADFVKLAQAKTIRANVFMVDVQFRPDQLKALQKFADTIFLKKS
jgi:hypothetical protein